MNFSDYVAIEAMNWSRLKDMHVSARLFRRREFAPRTDTAALEFGRLLHCALLEPEVFAATYVVEPDFGDLRFKVNKEARAEWRASNAGIPVSADDMRRVSRMAEAIHEHPAAFRLLIGATEQTITWTTKTGIRCKARLDLFTPRGVVDLKTTTAATPERFGYDASRYLYHGQVAWYSDGARAAGLVERPEAPVLLAVQSDEPHDVMVVRVDGDAIDAGRALWRHLLDRYAACRAADWWPGVAPDIVPLRLPAFAPGMFGTLPHTPDPEDF